MAILVGCAGWNIRKEYASEFPTSGTHLQRYASRFHAVEINSSFYRSHRLTTYQRWADSTPEEFRFSVKLPKQITHGSRLIDVQSQIEQFASETIGLAQKLGTVLVQLPPSLDFDLAVAEPFFRNLRMSIEGPIVCEPRHTSWFDSDADFLFNEHRIGRVAADPSIVPAAAIPGGYKATCYFRWHGSPQTYYSRYEEARLKNLAEQLVSIAAEGNSHWCIFDNTANGYATENALSLNAFLSL